MAVRRSYNIPYSRLATLSAALLMLLTNAATAQLGPMPGLPAASRGQPNGVAPLDGSGLASGLGVLPDGASTPRTLANRTGELVNVLDYGAVCDGVANDRVAINRAIAAAAARMNGGEVYFPRMCRSDNSTGGILVLSSVTLRGPARGRGGIVIDDSHGGGDGISNNNVALNDFHIRDMTVTGMRATLPSSGVQLIQLTNGTNLSIENSEFIQSRQMGLVIQRSNHVVIRGNRIFRTNADGIAVWDSSDVLISANTIEGANDDAISAHSNDATAAPVRSGLTITGNTITESQGIDVLGAKNVTIADNTLRRMMSYGIVVDTGAGVGFPTQGDTALFGVHITENTISDVFRRPETPYRDQEQYYIKVAGGPRVPVAGGSAPGNPAVGTGAVSPLLGSDGVGAFYTNAIMAGGSVPGPGGYWVDVTGNRLLRTLPAVAAYSDWGYNAALFVGDNGPANGLYNGPVTEAELNTDGIHVEPALRNSRVEGNTVQTSGPYAIFLDQSRPTAAGDYDGLLIQNNKLVDFQTSGLWANPQAAERIVVRGNEFDGDPRFVAPARGPHGTWAALSGPTAVPEGILAGAGGLVMLDNSFRNVVQAVVANTSLPTLARNNLIYAKPAAIGGSAANAGVGVLPPDGPEFGYAIEDSDPASATYGQMLSAQPGSAAAQPASGTFVAGHMVFNNSPSLANGGGTTLGWLRLTTGTGNVAGTDWATINAAAAGVTARLPLTLSAGSGTLGAGAGGTVAYQKIGPLLVSFEVTLTVPNAGTVPAFAPLSVAGLPFLVAGGCDLVGRENAMTGKITLVHLGDGTSGGPVLYGDNTSPVASGISISAGGVCQTYN